MDIKSYENIDLSSSYYNFKDKLCQHVFRRSEEAFEKANEVRSSIKTIEDLKLYTEKQRKDFIENMGGIPYDKSLPLDAKVTGIIEEEYFTIEKVMFTSRPGVYVTANLYLPKNRKEKCGAVLCQCGHAAEGKAYERYQKSVREIASCGLIVLCMDPIGQGERISYVEEGVSVPLVPPCTAEHQHAGEQCVLIGDTITRYFICDAMRAVDYLQSRPEVDAEKIGACGTSGGGTATCHMMVCDERIKAAAPGTFVTNRKEYLYSGNPQDSEQIWWNATTNGFDHNELLMCFAPKPVMLLVVDSDFFVIEGTKEVFEKTKPFFKMYDKEQNLKMFVDTSTHAFTDGLAIAAGEFFAEVLNGEKKSYIKDAVFALPAHQLNATESGCVKRDFPDSKIIFDENLERYNTLKTSHDKAKAKEFLSSCVYSFRELCEFNMRRPLNGEIFDCGYGITANMWFSQKYLPTYSLSFRNLKYKCENLPLVICLWDNGTNDLEGKIYKIRSMCDDKNRVVVLDLAGIGKNMPSALNSDFNDKDRHGVIDRLNKDLFFLGDSLCALRLYELEKAIDALKQEYNTNEFSIYAEGKSAVLAELFAVLHEETSIKTENGESIYNMLAEKYYEHYNCSGYLLPGILKYIEI